eukprot:CAMPEP_0185850392 /NCGR_PEP_ID=MMETSP1354-20130828/4537_1 /TAXON_ID=708628 /ORGANISM="Erythrolobus madagascarensis, Strain CCMP3276" /LENGTH=566 /DNA_ID=CAMNT_0028551061 /DNA_START=50 /DNA_END=1750 /DNA_ORIENTATION=+
MAFCAPVVHSGCPGRHSSSCVGTRHVQPSRVVGLLQSQHTLPRMVARSVSEQLAYDTGQSDCDSLSDIERDIALEEAMRVAAQIDDVAQAGDVSFPAKQKLRRRARLPVVAVIGRPNVGKSQLVNRISGDFKSGAIVEDVVGITRDRTYRNAFWSEYEFQVVDTGGLIFDDDPSQLFLSHIRTQALLALSHASVAILVVDGQAGINPLDSQIASFLRREAGPIPIVIAANKCESDMGPALAAEFWALGLGEPFAVSALHGTGTGDMLDAVVEHLPAVSAEELQSQNASEHDEQYIEEVSVAIVGRPNVGKSSLLNKLVGKERSIVSDIAGTTRDTVDDTVMRGSTEYRLLDTAGVRRKNRISYGTEFFMINRAFKSIRRSDVVLLVIDLLDGVTEQDRKLAERVVDEGRGCIIVANKWDAIKNKDNRSFNNARELIADGLPMLKWAPIVLTSALTGQRVSSLFSEVDKVLEQHRRRVSTAVLNQALEEMLTWHKPPSTSQAKQGKVYYCTQVASSPPTIAMFVNDANLFTQNYRRYAEGKFRESLGFLGTPVRVLWRSKGRAPSLT